MNAVNTPLLDRVHIPADLRNFSHEQLRRLADELRAETIDAVSVTGGHLGSDRRVKPDRPPPWRSVRMRSRRPVRILCG